MRILFDTNTLISAAITDGTCWKVLEHCVNNHQVFVSEFISQELERKLSEKFEFTKKEIALFIDPFLEVADIVSPTSVPAVILEDPDDDNILAAALQGNCDCMISGDKHVLALKEYEGISIMRAGQFFSFEAKFEE